MTIPECVMFEPGCDKEPCKTSNLYETLNVMKGLLDSYLRSITLDKLKDTDTNGHLNEILDLVELHIEKLKRH